MSAGGKGKCDGCGKVYRVPDASRRYTCKACGGKVSAIAPPPSTPARSPREAPRSPGKATRAPGAARRARTGAKAPRSASAPPAADDVVACAHCEALNPAGHKFCNGCGEPLPATNARRAESRNRREVGKALHQAGKSLSFVRNWVLWPTAIISALGLAVFLYGFASVEIPTGIAFVFIGFMAAMTALAAAGIILIHYHPFAWTTALAGLKTLDVVITWTLMPELMPVLATGWAVALWLAAMRLAPVARLIRENPEHYGARRLRRQGSRDQGPKDLEAAVDASRRADGRKAIWVSGSILLLALLGGILANSSRPPSVADSMETFVAAWAQSDLVALTELFPEDRRSHLSARFAQRLTLLGWEDELPEWIEYEELDQAGGDSRSFQLEVVGGRVDVRWSLDQDRWMLHMILPRDD